MPKQVEVTPTAYRVVAGDSELADEFEFEIEFDLATGPEALATATAQFETQRFTYQFAELQVVYTNDDGYYAAESVYSSGYDLDTLPATNQIEAQQGRN